MIHKGKLISVLQHMIKEAKKPGYIHHYQSGGVIFACETLLGEVVTDRLDAPKTALPTDPETLRLAEIGKQVTGLFNSLKGEAVV